MKSNLFSKRDASRSEELQKDMDVLVSLSDEVLARLPTHSVKIRLTRSGTEERKAADKASADLGVPRYQLDHALSLANLFITQFLKSGDACDDEPEDIVDDLETLLSIPEDKKSGLISFLKEIKALTRERVEEKLRQIRYSQSSLPVLRGISISVDLRVVFDEEFEIGSDIDSFKPKCESMMPMAIVNLEFDEGPTKNIYFQSDRRSLGLLIDHLRAAEKQFQAAEENLSLRENDND